LRKQVDSDEEDLATKLMKDANSEGVAEAENAATAASSKRVNQTAETGDEQILRKTRLRKLKMQSLEDSEEE
jgi:hypothetical protein